MDNRLIGSEDWNREIFQTEVREELFSRHQPTPYRPLLILLGGQPAAGKTRAQKSIQLAHADNNLVEITGDDLREFHPHYPYLAREEPLKMPKATSQVSGGLVKLALDHAIQNKFSVLLEGTFRNKEMVINTASRFAAAGYKIKVIAVATPGMVSRLSMEERSLSGGYPRVGRWTPPTIHEEALLNSSAVLSELEQQHFVSEIQIFSRKNKLFQNFRGDDGKWINPSHAGTLFRTRQNDDLNFNESKKWIDSYKDVFRKALKRPDYIFKEPWHSYLRLQMDARTNIEILKSFTSNSKSELSSADIRKLEQDQWWRWKVLHST
ncbi:hypothetical protein BSP99_07215 [Corynebacterium glutamicum]|uniref:zeta toxin family protein n=1 Tax=Corynebacterium TaxID=1716 RepID=UPI000722DD49|nr:MULTISPECIES: zeta toxin family protein [Corynebacterium]ALP50003.1 hypothetical protein AC079_07220 [Corynebacterium glutamicum]ANR62375.1 Zeta toxin family protein [[Brevibacterium] flavum ZL-1]ANR65381.1 Zeta toxin family protein [Corynebacterium glutamicum ZL-6]ANU33517.1 hypothetical protein BBD29_07015 [Corynebacterium glutamicum]APT07264.1 hypothetical protein BSP99_07215 [Corynebacterium glutamicum]